MRYAERNAAVFEELRGLELVKGKKVAENASGTTGVYSMDCYHSGVLERNVYIAFKENDGGRSQVHVQAALELGFISIVERYAENYLSEFPSFHGLARDSRGECLGVITEDFSCGGKYDVHEVSEFDDNLPRDLLPLLCEGGEYADLHKTCFRVNEQRRIGDFGDLIVGDLNYREHLMDMYFDKLDEFSIILDI
ncbi:MAG: hypothetical protein ACI83O_000131 [Patescibacteria group bacterium]|jgi:hypothetical protein